MEDFTIKTQTTTSEYAKVMLVGLYRKPGLILATIIGLYLLITVILDHLTIINYYAATPYFEFFCGLFLLLGPILITLIAVRQFQSNQTFRHDIQN